ncbi:carboxypeptidase-like regulatory domain-containing protein [Sulfurimonas sp. HSL-1656]|uniref:carboxypeptidase-like regulatory domain-containing protein n=1 Tax=Thiomicrolovo subterrani TaxID=3131934 RepID=UPI0031F7FD81
MAVILVASALLITACGGGGGGGGDAKTITISGMVTNAETNVSVEGAQVLILDAETRQNALDPVFTDANGNYTFDVPVDIVYEIRVAAQGFYPSPLDGVIGVPLSTTTSYDVRLKPISDGMSYGWLNLSLVEYSNDFGALVILTDQATQEHYTAVTSLAGDVMMYNLPVSDYNLTIRALGHETYSSDSNVSIAADTESIVDYIRLTPISGYSVSGTVKFLSITNSEVDVSLTDPQTNAVIPGTNVMTSNTNYLMSRVAPGDYYLRATYNIDGYVVDPDSIIKFGEPEVNVTNANVTSPDADIDVTGAVVLNSPATATTGVPVEIATTTPTFSWQAYPSTSDYVLELVDVDGNTIWGGFDENLTKLVNPPSSQLTYLYDGPALQDGAIYRWKVYASKDDSKEIIGWKLISASEEAQGVFKVNLAP